MVLAYLTSEYPARSHTFIRREIEVMRKLGFKLYSYSLHRCVKDEILNEKEQREYDDTWSVFPIVFKDLFLSHINSFLRSPKNYLSAFSVGFKYSGGSGKGIFYTFFYFTEAIYLARQLEKDNVEAIHVHFANSGAKVAAIASKYLDIPWMLSLHGSVDFEYPGISWLKNMVKHADSVRCVSDYGASQVKRVISRPEYKKIFISYCGLPSDYQDIEVKDNYQNTSPLRLLSVGRLSSEKGQALLLEAMQKLKHKGVAATLDIVGDGPDRTILEKECRTLGLENIVRFHGAVEEAKVFDYMREADIFVCSSYMEGLPQVLMEAMLQNTPVVAPYLAGIPELVADRRTGMLFPAGNVEALTDAIIELTSDQILYQKVAEAGRRKVLDSFVIENSIVPLVNRTRKLLSQNVSTMSSGQGEV